MESGHSTPQHGPDVLASSSPRQEDRSSSLSPRPVAAVNPHLPVISADTVTIRMRPSLLHQLLPSTVFMDYPADISAPRRDTARSEAFGYSESLLGYKCYWERNCIRAVLKYNGFKKKRAWTVLWHKHLDAEHLATLFPQQKVNHFQGSWCIGRKDRLARLMQVFKRLHGAAYGFHPESFILPADQAEFLRQANALTTSTTSNGRNRPRSAQKILWIAKPVASSCGRGISVISTDAALKLAKPSKNPKSHLLQRYVAKPYLIGDKKFDLRMYVLVTGVDPLRVYVYEQGLTRLSTSAYSLNNISDRFAHLTNYSINKNNAIFQTAGVDGMDGLAMGEEEEERDEECVAGSAGTAADASSSQPDGYKWSLQSFKAWLTQQEGADKVAEVFKAIEDVIVKTFIAAESDITPALGTASRGNCYEVFGCDILLDSQLRPHLLEVNVSPSLMATAPLDMQIKCRLLADAWHTVGMYPNAPLKSNCQYNGMGYCHLNKIMSTQEEYRKHPSVDSIDLSALSLIDRDITLGAATPTEPCAWWQMLIMIEDEISRSRSTLFRLVHPHGSSSHVGHYLSLYRNPRFNDYLLAKWLTAGGAMGMAGQRYLPPLVRQMLGHKPIKATVRPKSAQRAAPPSRQQPFMTPPRPARELKAATAPKPHILYDTAYQRALQCDDSNLDDYLQMVVDKHSSNSPVKDKDEEVTQNMAGNRIRFLQYLQQQRRADELPFAKMHVGSSKTC